MKQHVYGPKVVARLHIPEILNMIEHQEIDTLLKLSNNYNEYLIRVFCDGLELIEGCFFQFKMRNNSYHFTTDSWKEVFGIYVLCHEATLYDHAFHRDFDLRSYLNSCLKAPRPEDNLDKLSTGYLKRDPCIFHWTVTQHPRKGGHSQIDQAEVHLMYILHDKFKINWTNYFVSRIFVVRDCNKGSSLCYISMIAKILKHFCISVQNLQYISLGQAQEFKKSTMTHMEYHWYNGLKVYFNKTKGSGRVVYSYDDPAEFGIVNAKEQQVEEQVHHVDIDMVDTHHDDDHHAWLRDEVQHEDPQGWGQWRHNSWTQHGTSYGHDSSVDLSGKEYSIITLLEKNVC